MERETVDPTGFEPAPFSWTGLRATNYTTAQEQATPLGEDPRPSLVSFFERKIHFGNSLRLFVVQFVAVY